MNKYRVRTFKCAGCGKNVTKRARPNQKYCSLTCYRSSSRPGRKNGKTLRCLICKKKFYVPKSSAQRRARFCSRECTNVWQARHKTKHVCKICKKVFFWSPSRTKSHNIKYCSLSCRDKDPEHREHLLEMNRIQQRMKMSRLEKVGYEMLSDLGVEYESQYVIAGKFCVDAYIKSKKIVIQFDGDYWHGHPEKFPNPDKRQKCRMALDMSQDAYMKKCGYVVLRFWETDVYNNIERVKQVLLSAIQE